MIQRQQSLWLLLSFISAILAFKLPFYAGTQITETNGKSVLVDGASTFFLIVLNGGSMILALITIFLFKDRKLQLKLCFAGIAASLLAIVFYFSEIKNLPGAVALSAIFSFAIPAGFIMAARGIWKDEKLVKSLDKLR